MNSRTIVGLMKEISPRLIEPKHFRPYVDALQRAPYGRLRLAFSGPPQHGKTETTMHAFAWYAREYGRLRHAYLTYNIRRAQAVCKHFRRLLDRAKVPYTGTLDKIELSEGGSILFGSLAAGITGEPIDGVCVVDDPYADQEEADSQLKRDAIELGYRSGVIPRLHPNASLIVMCTRWHVRDIISTLQSEGYEYLNLQAIAEENDTLGRQIGEALCPELHPLESLEQKRREMLELTFQQMYQGHPRVRGANVFKQPTYYSSLPSSYQKAFGVDLAYSESTKADWSVIVELWREERHQAEPLFYVRQVIRRQAEIDDFAEELRALNEANPGVLLGWRCSGVERGSGKLLRRPPYNIPLRFMTPPGGKLVSARAVAVAWNQSRVLVPDPKVFPECEHWLTDFLEVLLQFTGNNKEPDDDVDALGNAHVLLPDPPQSFHTGALRRDNTW